MVINKDDLGADFADHGYALAKTFSVMSKNEIELGLMIVTGRQSVRGFLAVLHDEVVTSLEDSSLRDGVDWLVSKLCSGEVYCQYYSFSLQITLPHAG